MLPGVLVCPCSRMPAAWGPADQPGGCPRSADPCPGVTAVADAFSCPSSASPPHFFSPLLPAGVGCASHTWSLAVEAEPEVQHRFTDSFSVVLGMG